VSRPAAMPMTGPYSMRKAPPDRKDRKDRRVSQVPRVLKGQPVAQVPLGRKVLKALLVLQAPLEQREPPVLKVQRVLLDLKDLKDLPAPLAAVERMAWGSLSTVHGTARFPIP
jgi:hypothetical protein